MYITTTAARISHSVLDNELLKAAAAPCRRSSMLCGNATCACAACTASTASPSDAPGARLNDSVAAGNWPTWLRSSAVGPCSTRATAPSGTVWPLLLRTRRPVIASGPGCRAGSASSTTRYWLAWVKMVEICRCP
ncbi:hypothetical protein D3C72_1442930 [compost metagenome]